MKIRKIIFIAVLLLVVIVCGVIGYMSLLNVGFVDALYMTVITITTVGYKEVAVMNNAAKIFSIAIIFSGLAVVGYGLSAVAATFFEGRFRNAWRTKRMETKISMLKNHYIVCGAGEIGYTVIKCFLESNLDFVVIENHPERVADLKKEGVLTVLGDATHEDALEEARIKRAQGVVCTLSNDADNVFTVLTAKQMNEKVYIVSKAIEKNAHAKLLKAGADKTISPNEIGGQRMAALIIRPSVISFLDVITQAGEVTLDLEEIVISPRSELAGQMLRDAKIPERTGLIILALESPGDPNIRFNPKSSELLKGEDTMVVLGTQEQIQKLRELACK